MSTAVSNRVASDAPPRYSVDEYLERVYRWNVAEHRLQGVASSLLTAARAPLERRRARRLAARGGAELRLHLGCGDTYHPGWVNLDLYLRGHRRDLVWDLRRGLPFPDASVACIVSEHLFEHLPLDAGLALARECHRALAVGGVLRIGVPDLERYVRSYAGGDPLLDELRPGRPSRGIAFAELFVFYGHRAAYDAETLAVLLRAAGFATVERSAPGQGRIQPSPDSPRRAAETLYVEAVKDRPSGAPLAEGGVDVVGSAPGGVSERYEELIDGGQREAGRDHGDQPDAGGAAIHREILERALADDQIREVDQ